VSALRAADRYVRRGFAVVPIPHGKKGPILESWEGLRLTPDELSQHFNGKRQNIGLLLGDPSGGLVDVDLDAKEATKVARRLLPPTLTSGRASSPHSHWWYVSPNARTIRFKDVNGEVLVEVRSTGCQTIMAPSVHPSGERVVWHNINPEITKTEAKELVGCARELATATLIARHIPRSGVVTTTRWH
jgi:putative DNA primase/helicase